MAYQGALGRPLVCPEDCVGGLNADMLASFVEQNFKANRIVFAGSGMEHQELVSLVEPLVNGVKGSNQAEQPASKYIGGDFRSAYFERFWLQDITSSFLLVSRMSFTPEKPSIDTGVRGIKARSRMLQMCQDALQLPETLS